MLKWQTTSFAIAYMYLRLSVPVFPSPHQAKCSCFFGFVLFFLHSIKRCGWRCFGYQASQKKECVNAFASSFDCSKKQWCNWRSSSLVPPTPRHHIPSAWFTCSGNTVGLLLLLYPWQWTPAVALDPGSSDGLISMHGWGLRSSLIGPVSSWHGLGLNPAEDPAGCVHPPPPHHAHACCIPHDWILQDPETVLSCKVNVSARMSHWLTCNAGISLCTGHPKKKKRICKIRIWMSNQTFVRAVKTDRSYIIVFSSLVSQSYFHYFLNLPFFFFLQVTPSEGAPFKDVRWKENILCTTLSAVTFALSFDSPLPLSQPSSPDKKEPLLRCFARHYKTVAMDTQSEQAPHTGSRIGNDRCNILHL